MCRQTGRKKLGIGRRTFHRTITEMNVWAETLLSETRIHHGRGTGVRRGCGVGLSRGGPLPSRLGSEKVLVWVLDSV